MTNYFSVFDLIVLIGSVQGVIIGILLFSKKKNLQQNTILGILLFAFSIVSSKILLHTLDIWQSWFAYLPLGIDLIIPPLTYFYIVSFTIPYFRLRRKHLIHFVPALIFEIYSIFIYFQVVHLDIDSLKNAVASSYYYSEIKFFEDLLMLISLVFYLYIGFKKLTNYRKWIKEETSDSSLSVYNWLYHFLLVSFIIGGIFILNVSLDWFIDLNQTRFLHWKIFYIVLAVNIYYVGVAGYRQSELKIVEIEKNTNIPIRTEKLDEENTRRIAELLTVILEKEKIHTNPGLTLEDVANQLSIDKGRLSFVINHHFNKSFRKLINDYRVEEVLEALKSKKYEHLSLAGLALACGFNSESTFYRIIKKKTGKSPSEFRAEFESSH